MDQLGRIRKYLLLLLFAASTAACSGPAVMQDRADASDGPDAGELSGGVSLRFRTTPALNGALAVGEAIFTFTDIEVELSDLRLIGDAATGDERTRIELLQLRWTAESGPVRSAHYPEAPPGLYSIVRGAISTFEFDVDVDRDGSEDFTIELDYEQEPIAIDIALDSRLEAGTPLEIGIMIDFSVVVALIDLDELVVEDGRVEIHDDSPLLGALAEALSNSFAVQQVR